MGSYPEASYALTDDERANLNAVIDQHRDARLRKDWKAADAVRDLLKDIGVVIEVGKPQTTYRTEWPEQTKAALSGQPFRGIEYRFKLWGR